MIIRRQLDMAATYLRYRWRELHPFEVQALLLHACNLKCQYCKLPELPIGQLDTGQWRRIITELASLGTRRLKFQGGEPTLRPDFAELCQVSQAAGILTAVVTNGIKIAEQPALLDHLDELVVSVDSLDAEYHDHLRGAGSHAPALAAIDLALARGRRAFLVMVVTQDNLDHVEPMLEFCEARGVVFHAQPALFGRPPFDDRARHLALTDVEMRRFHADLARWKRQGRPLMFSARTYANVSRWPDFGQLTQPSDGDSACMAGKFYVHIEPNGDVLPCHQNGARFTPKNIVRDGLVEALRWVQHHDCGDCFTAYLNERKAVFALRPHALRELVRRG